MGLYEELVNVFGEGYVISEFDSIKATKLGRFGLMIALAIPADILFLNIQSKCNE